MRAAQGSTASRTTPGFKRDKHAGCDRPWCLEPARATSALALIQAARLQELADAHWFDRGADETTSNIEQETQVVDGSTFAPLDMSAICLCGRRPDTCTFIVELDASEVVRLTPTGIRYLAEEFKLRTRELEQDANRLHPGASVLHTGTHPFLVEPRRYVVADPRKRQRYSRLDAVTRRENRQRMIEISYRGKQFKELAANLTAMARCTGTQLHISATTAEDAVRAHNIGVAISGPMMACFANSPYVAGMDSGMASSRVYLLRQAEQRRACLSPYAGSLHEYFRHQIGRATSPFVELDDPQAALALVLGATHPSVRIIVDEAGRRIRNEYRYLDSQTPRRGTQALLLTYGLVQSLREGDLPSWPEAKVNFQRAHLGLKANMRWKGHGVTAQQLVQELIQVAEAGLDRAGFGSLARRLFEDLHERVNAGRTVADDIRAEAKRRMADGETERAAIAAAYLAHS